MAESRALGCLMGACIGDAAGAVLEHAREIPSEKDVKIALCLLGGGFLRTAPGQVTDDGELTISAARGLANCEHGFDIEKIAIEYANWAKSKPFDMGVTCGASIGCVLKGQYNRAFMDHLTEVGCAKVMKEAARYEGTTSKSNGSLMRCTPLGVYGYKLTDSEIAFIAREDSSLSHANEDVADAVSCYCIAIAELIKGGNRKGAFERAKSFIHLKNNREVMSWLLEAEQNVITPFCPRIGFIKIGFTHAFRHLLLGSDYVTAISETLAGGGDTDTNACIVGGLIGAAEGVEKIPSHLIHTLMNCNTQNGRPRPLSLHPKQIPDLVGKILRLAPLSLGNTNNDN